MAQAKRASAIASANPLAQTRKFRRAHRNKPRSILDKQPERALDEQKGAVSPLGS